VLDKSAGTEHKTMGLGAENRNAGQELRDKQIRSAVPRKKEKLGLNSEANLDSAGSLQSVSKNEPSRVSRLWGGSRITGREKAGRNRLHPEGEIRHFLHLLYFPPSLIKCSICLLSIAVFSLHKIKAFMRRL